MIKTDITCWVLDLVFWLARLAGLEPATGCLEGTAEVSRMVADLGHVQLVSQGRTVRSGRVGVRRRCQQPSSDLLGVNSAHDGR